jgi:hypothetical protein
VQAIEAPVTPLPEPLFDSDTLPEHLRGALDEILLRADTVGRRLNATAQNGDEAYPSVVVIQGRAGRGSV